MSLTLSSLKGGHIWALTVRALAAGLAGLGAPGAARSRRGPSGAPADPSEQADRATADPLQAAVRHMSQGLCLFDGEQRLVFCNARFAAIFALPAALTRPGVALREIMDYQVSSGSFPGNDADGFVRDMLRIVGENKSSKDLVEFRDGRYVAAAHEPTPGGGWVATFEDVTDRLRAQGDLNETRAAMVKAKAEAERAARQAQAANERLQEAFDLMPEGVVLFDSQDRLAIWNRRFAELNVEVVDPLTVGMGFEDLLRRGVALGRYPQAEGWEEQWLAMRRALHAMPYSSHEQRLSGDRWMRVEERRTGDGGHLGVRIDITELKRREASFKLLFDSNPLPCWSATSKPCVFSRSTTRRSATTAIPARNFCRCPPSTSGCPRTGKRCARSSARRRETAKFGDNLAPPEEGRRPDRSGGSQAGAVLRRARLDLARGHRHDPAKARAG